MIMVEDNLFVREDRSTGDRVIINSWGPGKLFANPVEQAAANVVINENSKYMAVMPQNSTGFFMEATFETAAKEIGSDLGSYYTTFISLMNRFGLALQAVDTRAIITIQRHLLVERIPWGIQIVLVADID